MSSFWRSAPGQLDDHRTTDLLPQEVDVLIIGAGYSGGALLTHMLSLDESKQKSFLVLEARQLCSGATGRNGWARPHDP
jgi:glycine/D-amino acid oxidase-like deaminating enzyme